MNYRTNEDKRCYWSPNRPLYNALIGKPVFTEVNPIVEPVSLAEVKRWLIIDDLNTDHDTLLGEIITRERAQLERMLEVSLIQRTVEVALKNELGNMTIPYQPIDANVAVIAKDKQGNDVTGFVITDGLLETPYSYVKLTFETGAIVPDEEVKKILLQRIAYAFEHRGDESEPKPQGPWLL